jgi:chalcone isomerase
MIRTIIFHHLPDMNDLPAAERWFYRYHIPEVLRNQPVRYVSYRAVPPPPGAEDFGYFNYKVHENVNRGEGEKPLGLTAMTKEVVPLKVIMVNVPATPTEDFLGKGTCFEEKTILRWVVVFRYPQGVSFGEGDDWYLNTHVPEVLRQPGLTRFFSYRIIAPPAVMDNVVPAFLHPQSQVSSDWHRVSELWYESSNGWVDSIVKSPPQYTRPPWAAYDRYPFFEPGVDFASTFILERPTDDWLRQVPPFSI